MLGAGKMKLFARLSHLAQQSLHGFGKICGVSYFSQVSFKPTIRLNTGLFGAESTRSATK